MRKGNWRIMAASTGSSQASLRRALAETICHCVTWSTAVDENLDLAAPPVTRDQTRHLRPAAARHLLQVTAHQSPLPTAELMVVLLAEHLLDPAIHLGLGLAFEPDGLAGIEKRRDLLQIEFLCFVHAGRQSSACHSSPGSSCVGIPLPAQAHLVLDKTRYSRAAGNQLKYVD